jgi:hypothetical protein
VPIWWRLIESQSCSACRGECTYVSGPAGNDSFEEESVAFPLALEDGNSLKGWLLPYLVETFACDVCRRVNELAGVIWHKDTMKWMCFGADYSFVLTNYMKKFPAFYGSRRFNVTFTRPSLVLLQSNPQYDSLLLLLMYNIGGAIF